MQFLSGQSFSPLSDKVVMLKLMSPKIFYANQDCVVVFFANQLFPIFLEAWSQWYICQLWYYPIFLKNLGKFNVFCPLQDSARQLTHLQSCLFFLRKAFAAEDNAAASAMLILSLLYCTFQMGNLQSQNSKHILGKHS